MWDLLLLVGKLPCEIHSASGHGSKSHTPSEHLNPTTKLGSKLGATSPPFPPELGSPTVTAVRQLWELAEHQAQGLGEPQRAGLQSSWRASAGLHVPAIECPAFELARVWPMATLEVQITCSGLRLVQTMSVYVLFLVSKGSYHYCTCFFLGAEAKMEEDNTNRGLHAMGNCLAALRFGWVSGECRGLE